MGNCLPCCTTSTTVLKCALKFPHGNKGVHYHDRSFVKVESVSDWVQSLYMGSTWTGWVAYNDDTTALGIKKTSRGHCKGIVAWNDTHLSWLIHSVPNFPRSFEGTSISAIEKSELLYGQSFLYVNIPYQQRILHSVFQQLEWMEANIFMKHNTPTNMVPYCSERNQVQVLVLDDTICHLAKPPAHHMDIYSQALVNHRPGNWQVETWKRGSTIQTLSPYVRDIEVLQFDEVRYKDSQDHSKWAVSEDSIWFGDLNRMESQYRRGGGGVVIRHPDLAKVLRESIIS